MVPRPLGALPSLASKVSLMILNLSIPKNKHVQSYIMFPSWFLWRYENFLTQLFLDPEIKPFLNGLIFHISDPIESLSRLAIGWVLFKGRQLDPWLLSNFSDGLVEDLVISLMLGSLQNVLPLGDWRILLEAFTPENERMSPENQCLEDVFRIPWATQNLHV